MPIVVEANEARKNRRSVEVEGYTNTAREEDKFFATLYIGAAPSTAAADLADLGGDKNLPQAYLVEQPADATVPPHFHDSDQFQVFVSGKVMFGKKAVHSPSLHYAEGHTPYGPIVTEDQGAQKLPPIFQARLISDLTQGLIDQTPGVFDGLRG